jgi:hypothetical protein
VKVEMNNFSYMINVVPVVGVIPYRLGSIIVNKRHEAYTCRFFQLAQKGKLLERLLY